MSENETCEINARLFESGRGDLFAQFMTSTVTIQGDGDGRVRSQIGWECLLCGAKGTGKRAAFHVRGRDVSTPIEALAWKEVNWSE